MNNAAARNTTRDLRPDAALARKAFLLAWMTDLHLDFVDETERAALAAEVVAARADGVVVTGDVATAADVLETIDNWPRPSTCRCGSCSATTTSTAGRSPT